jgi:hypothetical protein
MAKPEYVLATEFANAEPAWYDLAYEALFRADGTGEQVQHVVAQALKAAYEMGRTGRTPPWPRHIEPRRYERRPLDPEAERAYRAVLAMSETAPVAPVVARRRPVAAEAPAPAPVLLRRRVR